MPHRAGAHGNDVARSGDALCAETVPAERAMQVQQLELEKLKDDQDDQDDDENWRRRNLETPELELKWK